MVRNLHRLFKHSTLHHLEPRGVAFHPCSVSPRIIALIRRILNHSQTRTDAGISAWLHYCSTIFTPKHPKMTATCVSNQNQWLWWHHRGLILSKAPETGRFSVTQSGLKTKTNTDLFLFSPEQEENRPSVDHVDNNNVWILVETQWDWRFLI